MKLQVLFHAAPGAIARPAIIQGYFRLTFRQADLD